MRGWNRHGRFNRQSGGAQPPSPTPERAPASDGGAGRPHGTTLAATMKAAVWHGDHRIDVEELAQPRLDPGWALIRVELTGLCGTDLAIFAGHHQRARDPLVLGHEMVGIVETVNGAGPDPGSRVAVNPLLPCKHCWPCRHGQPHTCRQLRLLGIDRDGSLADFVAAPVTSLVSMKFGTPAQLAVFVEPLAVAVHAVGRAQVRPGHSIMIFGGGPIGVLTGLVARAAGAGPILVAEPNDQRRAIAREVGFEGIDAASVSEVSRAVLELTDGAGADITFDTAGHPSVPPALSAVTREHGTIVVAGLHHQPASLDLHAVTFAEQRLIGSRVYTADDFRTAAAAIDDDTLPLAQLPVRILPLAEASSAFRQSASHPEVVKVLIGSATPNL